MKIIRHGKAMQSPSEPMITECDRCGSVFTFTSQESGAVSNNGGGFVFFIKCPDCGGSCNFDNGYDETVDGNTALNICLKDRHEKLRQLISQDGRNEWECYCADVALWRRASWFKKWRREFIRPFLSNAAYGYMLSNKLKDPLNFQ